MGNIICAGNTLTVDINMGNFNIINLSCIIIGHGARLGNFVKVNPGSNISGEVILHNDMSVKTGTIIIQRIEIGEGTIIGAAVVNKSLPTRCTAVEFPQNLSSIIR